MFFAFATILYRSNRILLLKKIGILKERRRESQNRTLTVIICHFLYVALDKHTFEEKCFLKVEIQRIRGNYIFYPINQVYFTSFLDSRFIFNLYYTAATF